MFLQTIILCLLFEMSIILAAPPNDKALFEEDAEGRIRRRRPCRGRTPDGRTFFDWSLSYVDVDYTTNQNYNVICGGGGGGAPGGGGIKPQLDSGSSGGHRPHNKPHKPHFQGGLFPNNDQQGGNRPFGNGQVLNFVQSQSQSLFANLGSIWPQNGIGSLIPQNLGDSFGSLLSPSNGGGGLFNGQGVSSLFENGLFSNIFNTRPSTNQNQPQPPINRPINNNNPGTFPTQRPQVTTLKPDVQDPDDVIYNDEKPVHEDHDAIVPDPYYNNFNRPGQYLVASNPVFGTHVADLTIPPINVDRVLRRVNRKFNRFLDNLFRR